MPSGTAAFCCFSEKTGSRRLFVVLFFVVLIVIVRLRLVEDAAQEDADEVQQHHGACHHALGHDVRRGDNSRDEEDDHDGHTAHLLEERGVDDAHLGQDDRDQGHVKHTAEDDEHRQAEVDVALNAGGGLDVLSALDGEMRDIIDEAYETCRRTLTEHIDQLHALAKALMEREKLNEQQFNTIMAGGTLPPLEDVDAKQPEQTVQPAQPVETAEKAETAEHAEQAETAEQPTGQQPEQDPAPEQDAPEATE